MLKHVLRIAWKDFQIQTQSILKFILIAAVFIMVFSIVGGEQKQMGFSVAMFIILYGYVNQSLYADEKNNTLRLLVSMPVKRDAIVYARYLGTGMFAFALGLLIGLAVFLIDGPNAADGGPGTLLAVFSIFLVYIIMMAVYLPLAFKLGYIRAAGINRFVFLGIFALFTVIPLLVVKLSDRDTSEFVLNLDRLFSRLDPGVILVCFIAFALIIYLSSMAVSVMLFRKRLLFRDNP